MWADGFNKSTYQQLTTSELCTSVFTGLWVIVKKINCSMEKMNGIFTSRTRLSHYIPDWWLLPMATKHKRPLIQETDVSNKSVLLFQVVI